MGLPPSDEKALEATVRCLIAVRCLDINAGFQLSL